MCEFLHPMHHPLCWHPLPSLKQARGGSAYAVLGSGSDESLVVAGGTCERCQLQSCETLDLGAGCWRPLPDLPSTARTQALGAAVGKRFFVLGGLVADARRSRMLGCLHSLDLREACWSNHSDMSVPRLGSVVGIWHDELWAFGGITPREPEGVSTGEVFDTRAGAWRPAPPMRWPRAGAVAAQDDASLMVAGGTESSAPAELFDFRSQAWCMSTAAASEEKAALCGSMAAAWRGRFWLVGGAGIHRGGMCRNEVSSFDSTDGWLAGPPLCLERMGAVCLPLKF
eukprot:gnl/TRDRNA2_/TRDRNA2_202870_c0_seq1.p1 gnl/TRDRNA2_/TRDRNA2_202870_c0~~gnl/TRDRNA2_/TRDRNA2_202870_c0_seq1.p1  ORF type:complete len:307 (+),score=21.43 gnl/TRDRNA2_/TRDRNA2_202870_c0_seq1:70-921(+)